MTRRMSCSLTVDAVRARTKTVTRRKSTSWTRLQPGDRLTLVEKAMGLLKGARQVVLAEVEIVANTVEPIGAITPAEIQREGVNLDMTPTQWALWWMRSHDLLPRSTGALDIAELTQTTLCRRIEWRYLECDVAAPSEQLEPFVQASSQVTP